VNTSNAVSTRRDLTTKQTIGVIGLAGVISLLLTIVPVVGVLNYPFRLLITFVHELGHGLAAVLTGGEFIRFVVEPTGAGLAYTAGGWRWLVIPAGYLGVALFGALLIILGRSYRWSRIGLALIGALLIYFSLWYGAPSIWSGDMMAGLLTVISGAIFGALILFVALKASPGWIIFLLHFIAIQAGLLAFADLMMLIGLSTRFFDMPNNDALSMAELTLIPALVWAVLWAGMALLIIGGAIWFTWIRPLKKAQSARPVLH
jgi:hypothetical protein